MKKVILALFFVCANTFLFAQGAGADTLSSSPHRTNGEDSIAAAYLSTHRLALRANVTGFMFVAEYNITKRLTTWGEVGLPWTLTFHDDFSAVTFTVDPLYSGGMRYYYNFEKRAKAQKRIDGFAGNYTGLMWIVPLKWGHRSYDKSSIDVTSEPVVSLELVYGLQRPIRQYGYIDFNLGLALMRYAPIAEEFFLSFNAHYKNEPLWYFIGMTGYYLSLGLNFEKIFNKDRYGLPDKIQRMPPGAGKRKRLPKRYSEKAAASAAEYLDSRRLTLKANLVHLSAAAEYSLAPRWSAWGQVGFPWTATYYAFLEVLQFRLNPAYLGGLRYYHNFEKRAGYQKRIDGFSGNYAGLMWEVPLKWQLITYNNGFELQPVIQLLGVYGIQRPLGKYGYIDLGVGVGPKYTTLSKNFYLSEYDGIETGAFNYIWGMLSFQVNGGLRLEKIWSKDKDNRRRKFR